MPHAAVHEQRAGRPDLDVIGVRADGQDGLPGRQPGGASLGDQCRHAGQQLIRRHRFLQELVSTIPQRAHGVVERRMTGQHGDIEVRGGLPQRLQELQAGHAGHLDVGEHQIPGLRRGALQRDGGVEGVRDVETAAGAQQIHQETAGHHVVVDDEDASR